MKNHDGGGGGVPCIDIMDGDVVVVAMVSSDGSGDGGDAISDTVVRVCRG